MRPPFLPDECVSTRDTGLGILTAFSRRLELCDGNAREDRHQVVPSTGERERVSRAGKWLATNEGEIAQLSSEDAPCELGQLHEQGGLLVAPRIPCDAPRHRGDAPHYW